MGFLIFLREFRMELMNPLVLAMVFVQGNDRALEALEQQELREYVRDPSSMVEHGAYKVYNPNKNPMIGCPSNPP